MTNDSQMSPYGIWGTFWILLHVVKTPVGKTQWSLSLILSFVKRIVQERFLLHFSTFWCRDLNPHRVFSIFHLLHNREISLNVNFLENAPKIQAIQVLLLVSAMDFVFKVSNEYSTRTYSLLFWLYRITPKLSRIQMVHYILIEC